MTSTEFRSIRLQLGMNQTELGQAMGMGQQDISRIEAGKRKPTLIQQAFIRMLAECLKDTPDENI